MLKELTRLVVLLVRRIRKDLTTAQDQFIGGEAAGGFGEDALLLKPGELDGHRADGAADDVGLHSEDVLELGVVAFGPDMAPSRGLGQPGVDANPGVGAPDAAVEEIAGIEQPPDFAR